jgi:hypothetical protein
VATAALVALSIAHVAFSRKALTDVPFLLTWLIAVGLGGRFLEKPGLGRAIALGLAVGIAQNFKYNGWIAGAVIVLAALLGLIANREERKAVSILKTFGFGLIAVVVAALVYWPWYQFVETHGGYAALVKHHQSYLKGPDAWVGHWRHQLAQVVALSGGVFWGILAWSVAWLGCALAVNGPGLVRSKTRWELARLRLGALIGGVVLAMIPDLAWWVGLAWVSWLVFDSRQAVRVLGCWWLILSVMTPFYHPYARLWLPLRRPDG